MPESRSRKKASVTPPARSGATAPKTSPAWLVPTMLTLMIGGLVWVVVTYISGSDWPVPGIGQWNLTIGLGLIIAGFALTTRWR